MNADSQSGRTSGARWIAAGFIGAFAASILTVILTGLNVESVRGTPDAGFRSVTMAVGEIRRVELEFESERASAGAVIELSLPDVVAAVGNGLDRLPVRIEPGSNAFTVELRAVAIGNGFVEASLSDGQRIDGERVFITVVESRDESASE